MFGTPRLGTLSTAPLWKWILYQIQSVFVQQTQSQILQISGLIQIKIPLFAPSLLRFYTEAEALFIHRPLLLL